MSVTADLKHNNDGSVSLTLEGGNSRIVRKAVTQEGVIYTIPKDVYDAMVLAFSGSKPKEEKPKRGRKKKEEKTEEEAVEEAPTTDADEALKEL